MCQEKRGWGVGERGETLTVRLLPVYGCAGVRGRGREDDLTADSVPVRGRCRGVVDGPQDRVDERV